MSNLNTLQKLFNCGDPLYAEDLNELVAKSNEIIQYIEHLEEESGSGSNPGGETTVVLDGISTIMLFAGFVSLEAANNDMSTKYKVKGFPLGWTLNGNVTIGDNEMLFMISAQLRGTEWITYGNDYVWSGPYRIGSSNTTSETGTDDDNYNYIYCRTNDIGLNGEFLYPNNIIPNWDTLINEIETASLNNNGVTFNGQNYSNGTLGDNYVWTDHPFGVDEDHSYEWWVGLQKQNNSWVKSFGPIVMSHFGKDGRDGDGLEYIFYKQSRDNVNEVPTFEKENGVLYRGRIGEEGTEFYNVTNIETDEHYQQDDFIPEGWHDNHQDLSDEYPVEYFSVRKRKGHQESNDKWGNFSTPKVWREHATKGFKMTLDNDTIIFDDLSNADTIEYVSYTKAYLWEGDNNNTFGKYPKITVSIDCVGPHRNKIKPAKVTSIANNDIIIDGSNWDTSIQLLDSGYTNNLLGFCLTKVGTENLTEGSDTITYTMKVYSSSNSNEPFIVMSRVLSLQVKNISDGEAYSLIITPNTIGVSRTNENTEYTVRDSTQIDIDVVKVSGKTVTEIDFIPYQSNTEIENGKLYVKPKYYYNGEFTDSIDCWADKNYDILWLKQKANGKKLVTDIKYLQFDLIYGYGNEGIVVDSETVDFSIQGDNGKTIGGSYVISTTNDNAIIDDLTIDNNVLEQATLNKIEVIQGNGGAIENWKFTLVETNFPKHGDLEEEELKLMYSTNGAQFTDFTEIDDNEHKYMILGDNTSLYLKLQTNNSPESFTLVNNKRTTYYYKYEIRTNEGFYIGSKQFNVVIDPEISYDGSIYYLEMHNDLIKYTPYGNIESDYNIMIKVKYGGVYQNVLLYNPNNNLVENLLYIKFENDDDNNLWLSHIDNDTTIQVIVLNPKSTSEIPYSPDGYELSLYKCKKINGNLTLGDPVEGPERIDCLIDRLPLELVPDTEIVYFNNNNDSDDYKFIGCSYRGIDGNIVQGNSENNLKDIEGKYVIVFRKSLIDNSGKIIHLSWSLLFNHKEESEWYHNYEGKPERKEFSVEIVSSERILYLEFRLIDQTMGSINPTKVITDFDSSDEQDWKDYYDIIDQRTLTSKKVQIKYNNNPQLNVLLNDIILNCNNNGIVLSDNTNFINDNNHSISINYSKIKVTYGEKNETSLCKIKLLENGYYGNVYLDDSNHEFNNAEYEINDNSKIKLEASQINLNTPKIIKFLITHPIYGSLEAELNVIGNKSGLKGNDGLNGLNGADGYSVVANPATVTLNEYYTNPGHFPTQSVVFSISGNSNITVSNVKVYSSDNVTATRTNTTTITIGIDSDSAGNHPTRGYVEVDVTLSNGLTPRVKILVAINWQGTIRTTIEGSVETTVAQQVETRIENGDFVTTKTLGTFVRSSIENSAALTRDVNGKLDNSTFRQTVDGFTMELTSPLSVKGRNYLLQSALFTYKTRQISISSQLYEDIRKLNPSAEHPVYLGLSCKYYVPDTNELTKNGWTPGYSGQYKRLGFYMNWNNSIQLETFAYYSNPPSGSDTISTGYIETIKNVIGITSIPGTLGDCSFYNQIYGGIYVADRVMIGFAKLEILEANDVNLITGWSIAPEDNYIDGNNLLDTATNIFDADNSSSYVDAWKNRKTTDVTIYRGKTLRFTIPNFRDAVKNKSVLFYIDFKDTAGYNSYTFQLKAGGAPFEMSGASALMAQSPYGYGYTRYFFRKFLDEHENEKNYTSGNTSINANNVDLYISNSSSGGSYNNPPTLYIKDAGIIALDEYNNITPSLKRTGIDIQRGKITAQTDNFEIVNSQGKQTFSIDQNGNIVGAGNASFNGTVYATNGEFTGTVHATSGEFTGTIRSKNFYHSICTFMQGGNYLDETGETWLYYKTYNEDVASYGFVVGNYYSMSQIDEMTGGQYYSPNGFVKCTYGSDIVNMVPKTTNWTKQGDEGDEIFTVLLPSPQDFVGKTVEVFAFSYDTTSISVKVGCVIDNAMTTGIIYTNDGTSIILSTNASENTITITTGSRSLFYAIKIGSSYYWKLIHP